MPRACIRMDGILSRSTDESDPKVMPVMSGDRTAPELQGEGVHEVQNPFPTDVYYVGNLLRIQFLYVRARLLYVEGH